MAVCLPSLILAPAPTLPLSSPDTKEGLMPWHIVVLLIWVALFTLVLGGAVLHLRRENKRPRKSVLPLLDPPLPTPTKSKTMGPATTWVEI